MTETTQHKVESWDINKVFPYEDNAKKHDEFQVQKIATSISSFGWDQPIVVDKDGVIIKGHGRHLAAQKLNMTRVPVICRKDLSEDQVKAARLADNRVAQGEYDVELIQKEMESLFENDFDLNLLGFDENETDFLIGELDELDPDALITDLDEEVSKQDEKTDKTVKETGSRNVSISEALGFKTVSVENSRLVSEFMAYIEDATGEEGAEAFISFAEHLLTNSEK